MGFSTSSWSYFVPYEEDIRAALQRLREDVFARGEYLTDWDILNEPMDWDAAARRHTKWANSKTITEETRQHHVAEAKRYTELAEREKHTKRPQRPPPLKTIEDLLEEQEETGTHSILDIAEISSKPKLGAVTPFPPSELVTYFNTDKPTREVIEDRYEWGALEKFTSKRYRGIYIIAYKDQQPTEIFFAGSSGL